MFFGVGGFASDRCYKRGFLQADELAEKPIRGSPTNGGGNELPVSHGAAATVGFRESSEWMRYSSLMPAHGYGVRGGRRRSRSQRAASYRCHGPFDSGPFGRCGRPAVRGRSARDSAGLGGDPSPPPNYRKSCSKKGWRIFPVKAPERRSPKFPGFVFTKGALLFESFSGGIFSGFE